MIAIIDYGAGNLKSVKNALDCLNVGSIITDKPEDVLKADRLILPGDGSFGYMMENLGKKGLVSPIKNFIKSGKPFLGICLGLQGLFEESEESPNVKGLSILKGKVVKLRKGKVPQIGWNNIFPKQESIFKDDFMYFVNSYYVVPKDASIIAAVTDYNGNFVSAIQSNNITAMQFHPEKSGGAGIELLKRWLKPRKFDGKFSECQKPEVFSMLTKRIIPCLDVKNGQVVKGRGFVNLKYAGNPAKLARKYYEEGADELVFLDITASYEKRKTMIDLVEKIAKQIFIPFTVGGGISTIEDIRNLLKAGADKISINTAAINNPDLIKEAAEKFGSQCIVAAIDAKKVNGKWKVFVKGGRQATGLDAIKWAKKVQELGAGEILLTSMDKDGTKYGYDLDLTRRVSESVNIPLIASGGAGSLKSIEKALKEGKADAALAASIFHYKKYSIKQVKRYLQKKGIGVRI